MRIRTNGDIFLNKSLSIDDNQYVGYKEGVNGTRKEPAMTTATKTGCEARMVNEAPCVGTWIFAPDGRRLWSVSHDDMGFYYAGGFWGRSLAGLCRVVDIAFGFVKC
jgi:hypothetical protein